MKLKTIQEPVEGQSTRYGDKYWSVELTNGGYVTLMADTVEVTAHGDLLFSHDDEKGAYVTFAVAAGKWCIYYAASLICGSAVAVEHWKEAERGA